MRTSIALVGVLLSLAAQATDAASRSECTKMAGDLKGESRKEFMQRCTNPESLSDAGKPKRGYQDGYYWSSIELAEKVEVARVLTRSVGGTYSPIEMVACLQAFYKRPAPDQLLRQEITAVAVVCHAQLR